MRRARGVLVLVRSVLLGLALIAAVQPGAANVPDLAGRWAGAAPSGTAVVVAPLVAKRW